MPIKKTFLLLSLVFPCLTFGQTELNLSLGAKYLPTDWMLYNQLSHPGYFNRDALDYWPLFQADIGIRTYDRNSNWFFETDLSYRHTRIIRTYYQFPDEIDPFYGFVRESAEKEKRTATDLLNYVGVKIGSGYRFSSRNARNPFVLSFGVQAHFPVASKYKWKPGGPDSDTKLYRGEEFKRGIYYGIYLKPTYQFSFSRKRTNPWRFSIYAEGDALIHNTSSIIPKFLWGGGLGVSYKLGNSF